MDPGKPFSGRAALVTGAAFGIGKAIAEKLALQGASVALLDIESEVENVAESLVEQGFEATACIADVGDPASVNHAVQKARKAFGTVHVLVNNAGVVRPAAFDDVTGEDWEIVLRINLKGTYYCTRACVPLMKAQSYGKIVNIGSRAALGKLDRTVYSASKAGIAGMTRTLALELAPFNINVNNVAPGPIATERFTENNPPDSPKTRAILESVPLSRMGTPQDVAEAVAFLASDAAAFITGQTLYVCGGLTISSV